MNVVFASPGFSPSRSGRQPWAYVDRVAQDLTKRGFELTILTDEAVPEADRKKAPFAIEFRPQMGGLLSWFRGPPPGLFRNLGRADTLVSFLGWPNIPAWPKLAPDRRQIVALTSPPFNNGEWRTVLFEGDTNPNRLHLLLSQLAALAMRPADFEPFDGVVAMSSAVYRLLSRHVPRKPLLHAQSGVDKDVLRYDRNESEGYSDGDPVITYCGPPRRSRGVHVFLEALRILQDSLPRVRGQLLLRPDSSQDRSNVPAVIRTLADLPAPSQVTVRSAHLPRDEFLRALSSSTVCGFPFQYPVSLTPLTLLEAIAMGISAVVTPVGDLPEVVGEERGLIAEGTTPQAFGDALHEVLALNERVARPPAPRPPTWEEIGGQWAEFLDSLA